MVATLQTFSQTNFATFENNGNSDDTASLFTWDINHVVPFIKIKHKPEQSRRIPQDSNSILSWLIISSEHDTMCGTYQYLTQPSIFKDEQSNYYNIDQCYIN